MAHLGPTSVAFVLLSVVLYRLLRKNRLPYPPGPPGLPIVGKIFGMPRERSWMTFAQWSSQYGSDIVSVNVLGTRLVILNSHAAVQDLLVKRSLVYSDRADMMVIKELFGWDWHIAFMKYGPKWREHRKLFRQEAEYPENRLHQPHSLGAARRLLKSILNDQEDFFEHVRHMAGSIAILTSYGVDVKPRGDPLVALVERANESAVQAGDAGFHPFDLIPPLRNLPTWIPGVGSFHRRAKYWKSLVHEMRDETYAAAKRSFNQGTGKYCIASRVLEQIQKGECQHTEEVLRNVLGAFYTAAAETTVSALLTFLLAMTMFPEVQRKAQEAIAAVVDKDTFPEFRDIESIPYLSAVVRETLRWQLALPLSIPHATSEDDIYQGYYIPKGSIVIGNSWAVTREEGIYGPNPHLFQPERFLTPDEKTLNTAVPEVAFGYGRRRCPGQVIGYSSLLIAIASLLHCFNMNKGKDELGKDIEPSLVYSTGLASSPPPFRCIFVPRSPVLARMALELPDHNE